MPGQAHVMVRVTIDDLQIAAYFLQQMEHGGGPLPGYNDKEEPDPEWEACQRVASWLECHVDLRIRNKSIRNMAKKTGRSEAEVRKILRKKSKRGV